MCHNLTFISLQLNSALPLSLSLRPLDVEFMRRLSKVVNIVPVIAKADTLTLEERDFFKKKVTSVCLFFIIDYRSHLPHLNQNVLSRIILFCVSHSMFAFCHVTVAKHGYVTAKVLEHLFPTRILYFLQFFYTVDKGATFHLCVFTGVIFMDHSVSPLSFAVRWLRVDGWGPTVHA